MTKIFTRRDGEVIQKADSFTTSLFSGFQPKNPYQKVQCLVQKCRLEPIITGQKLVGGKLGLCKNNWQQRLRFLKRNTTGVQWVKKPEYFSPGKWRKEEKDEAGS